MDQTGDEDYGEEEQEGGADTDADGDNDGDSLAAGICQSINQRRIVANLSYSCDNGRVLGLSDVVHGLDGEHVLGGRLEAGHSEAGGVDGVHEDDSALGVEADGCLRIVFDSETLLTASIKPWNPSQRDRITGNPCDSHMGGCVWSGGCVQGDNLVRNAHGVSGCTLVLAIVGRVDVQDVELGLPGDGIDHGVFHLVLAAPC